MVTVRGRRYQLLGARTAVLLAGVVAVLSLATGLANITTGVATGPFAAVVPDIVRETAGFTGTLTGFLMLLSAYGLRDRLRLGWYATVGLLPLTAMQGIFQASVYSAPLVVLSILSLPALLVNYDRFDASIRLSNTQIAAILALTGTLTYGTVGGFALQDEFQGLDGPLDAFYYTVVTASTVGYGDITPLSQQARLFGTSLVVLGTVSFAVALGSVLGPAIEARFSHALGTMTDRTYDLFEDHILVLGYGDLTEPLLDELAGTEFVVITPDNDSARHLRERDIDVLVADPSDEAPLEDAGIASARAAIAATNNDAEDAFAILTARELNRDLRIVAAATATENVDKLRRAGADSVVSPAVIGGKLLVRSALDGEDVSEFGGDDLPEF